MLMQAQFVILNAVKNLVFLNSYQTLRFARVTKRDLCNRLLKKSKIFSEPFVTSVATKRLFTRSSSLNALHRLPNFVTDYDAYSLITMLT